MQTATRTYRVKLYPSRSAHRALEEQLRAQCRLYNSALEHRRWAWKMAGERDAPHARGDSDSP